MGEILCHLPEPDELLRCRKNHAFSVACLSRPLPASLCRSFFKWMTEPKQELLNQLQNDGATLKTKTKKNKNAVQAWRIKINMNISAERQEMICSNSEANLANFRWANNLFLQKHKLQFITSFYSLVSAFKQRVILIQWLYVSYFPPPVPSCCLLAGAFWLACRNKVPVGQFLFFFFFFLKSLAPFFKRLQTHGWREGNEVFWPRPIVCRVSNDADQIKEDVVVGSVAFETESILTAPVCH